MEEDLKKISETLIKIQEIIIPEMIYEIDMKINNHIKNIENTLLRRSGSAVPDPITEKAIDSFKQILDSNSQSIKHVIETEVNHIFLVIFKEFKKMTAFIRAKSSMKDLPYPLKKQLHILLQDLPNSFSQSIEQALMPIMKEFQSIDEHLRNVISSTTDSTTFLVVIQGLTNRQLEKIDSLQKETLKDFIIISPLHKEMKKITAFLVYT